MKDYELELRYDPSILEKEYLLQPSSKFIPSWYKELPAKGFASYLSNDGEEVSVRTVKSCPGVIRGMSRGFVLPCPFDFYVRVTGTKYEVTTAPGCESRIDVHDPAQANFATGSKFLILKIAPWFTAWCKERIDFIYVNPVLHNFAELGAFQIPSAVVDFKDQHSVNAFVLIPLDEESSTEEKIHFVRKGSPLAQFIPITEGTVTLSTKECINWGNPPQNTLSGMTTWFDSVKYLRRIRGE